LPWEFWIDRGGTFTDCIGRGPDGALHLAKLPSSDDAPAAGVRRLLERAGALGPGGALPSCLVKLGTTVATNALLERRGVPTLLVTQRGLADVFAIGTQERPDLFDLAIRRPPPLHERAVEVDGRVGAHGEPVTALDREAARRALALARAQGVRSAAVVCMHAYAYPALEDELAALAREAGFAFVVASREIAAEIGFLARGETACADAYLTPLLRGHVEALSRALPGARLRFMQSSGGLTNAARFRGPGALLSGPAGGAVGAARVAALAGHEAAVGFDMGGTSTDVSLLLRGEVESAFETRVAGLRVRAPMLRVHTVAAGGGSLCRFDGVRLRVGPESAGAHPGPLCYGAAPAGPEPEAGLALTDVNLFLGRIPQDRFPLPIQRAPVEAALAALESKLAAAGHPKTALEIAAGFVEIANAHMARAIEEVSVARGVDPRDLALVGFGGAAGQHVCAVARSLGMRTVLLHPLAGLLSAFGIGCADLACDRSRDAGRVRLGRDARGLPAAVRALQAALESEAREALRAEGAPGEAVRSVRLLDLRYVGAETALTIAEPADGDYARAFEAEHRARFGYVRPERAIEITTARARARAPAGTPPPPSPGGAVASPTPARVVRAWFPGAGFCEAPLFERAALAAGARFEGPAILLQEGSTVVVDPGFDAALDRHGILTLRDAASGSAPAALRGRGDPVWVEVMGHRFMSIAEQMGAVLRNTAVSTNIKERLDSSCAVFDREGRLVANAPHIPVHLGAMGETVRAVRRVFPDLAPGDVVCTNDPSQGGSHLPDVTLVTPVFAGEGDARAAPAFFVATRGHHADLGGITPGSMPADSTTLEEEGVLLRPFRLVHAGHFDEPRLRRLLTEARHPARNPDDNLADLEAMVAANRQGERLLSALVEELGCAAVEGAMAELMEAAAALVAREIRRVGDGSFAFADALDDGTPVCVRLEIAGDRLRVDFTGTGPAVAGNLNAPRAVTQAAVLYALRALVAERIPLNAGCLFPVEIRIPPRSLLDPPPGAAVVGGNVETSQRIVDVLLGALGRAAASQGTMNNLSFGDARFGYYETIGGGAGAGPGFDGASGVHTHMTNTRITDAEVLETRYPVRLERFALRRGSGGAGVHRGGDGVVRAFRFLAPVEASVLSERRVRRPFGLAGGEPGLAGRNRVLRADGRVEELPGRAQVRLGAGDGIVIETPGGGGYGPAVASAEPSRD
jgi:5-oxoprolinase (ATP-hydrolysing)